MGEAEAGWIAFNPFDLTKIWPHAEFLLIEISTLELNHNAENYLSEVEPATFWVANLVPGTGLSPDKILQMRAVSNFDAQWYHLGANHQARLVYEPRCVVHTCQREGAMCFDGNSGGSVNFQPNGFGGPVADLGVGELELYL